jgi:hypothetical protein
MMDYDKHCGDFLQNKNKKKKGKAIMEASMSQIGVSLK